MSVLFTADLHLGHRLMAELRGYDDVDAHDAAVIDALVSTVGKRDKLFVLGDVAWNRRALRLVDRVPGIKVLVLGNHDKSHARLYLEHFDDVHGALRYKGFLLTHLPIHPQELQRFRANVHGHIHEKGCTGNPGQAWTSQPGRRANPSDPMGTLVPLENRYLNVNLEFHGYRPVPFEVVDEAYPRIPRDAAQG